MKSTQKYIRISPQKIRLLADSIRGLTPPEALEHLRFMNKRSSDPLYKVIKSALANAKVKKGLSPEALKFKSIDIGKGPTYKRWRAVSRGAAHSVFKRTSHITVELEEKNGSKN